VKVWKTSVSTVSESIRKCPSPVWTNCPCEISFSAWQPLPALDHL